MPESENLRSIAGSVKGRSSGFATSRWLSHPLGIMEPSKSLPTQKSRSLGLKPLCAAVPSEHSVRVAAVGLGYVGLPLAASAAAAGANFVGLDIDPAKVESVFKGRRP